MFSFVNETVTAWLERAKTPILGYFALSFVVLNWQPLWVLFLTDTSYPDKFKYFDENTSLCSLVIWPFLAGAGLMLALPWLRLIGLHVVRAPIKKYTNLQHDHGQELRIYRLKKAAEEFQAQAEYDASYEQAKIDAAERMARAREVGGENLKNELEVSRSERKEDSNEVTPFTQTRQVRPDPTQARKAVQMVLDRQGADAATISTDEQCISLTASDITEIFEALSGLTMLEISRVVEEKLKGIRVRIQGQLEDIEPFGEKIKLLLSVLNSDVVIVIHFDKQDGNKIEAADKGITVEVTGALQDLGKGYLSIKGYDFRTLHPEPA